MYGNAPRAVWVNWSPPDEKNRITLACRALLLETDDGRRILFETGIGAFFEPKLKERFGVVESEHVLLQSLAKLGVTQDQIDVVVLSHLHFDHAGGMLSAYEADTPPKLLFPNARIYVGKTHWERAIHAHMRDRASFIPALNDLLEKSGQLTLVDDSGKSDLAPLITFRFSNGHTPGLMLSEIHLPSGPVVFAADLIPGTPWVHLPITMGYDRYAELLIDEKKALLDDLVTKNGKIYFTHDPQVACGAIRRDNTGKYSATPVDIATLS